jgi:acyl carrier protein
MPNTDDVIHETLARVMREEGLDPAGIADDARLVDDLGLKSLHIARVLALLELELDRDPFVSGDVPITSIRTVGDLCDAYA